MFRKIAKKILTKSPKTYTAVHTANFELTHRQDFSKLDKKAIDILMEVKKNGYTVIPDFFEKSQLNNHLVEHFSPLVSPEKVLKMGQVN